jgi:hypothetical protein
MANYPGLEPYRPFGSLIAGMEAADKMEYSGLRNEAMRAAVDQQKEQRSALQTYKETGDARGLIPYVPPETAVKLKEHFDQQTPETLKGYEQASNFLIKSRPVITPGNWSAVNASMVEQGWLPPKTFPNQVSPQQLQQILGTAEFYKAYATGAGQKPAVHEFGTPDGKGVQPMQYDAGTRSWIPVGPVKRKEFAPKETPQEVADKARAVQAVKAEAAPTTIWGNMKVAAKAGNWSEFEFYQKLWNQQHPGSKPQLFKNDSTGTYQWVQPEAGKASPAGFHPVSEDMFKALLAGQLGNTIVPPAPPGTDPNAAPAPAATSSISPLQQRAIDEKARRGR